MSDRQKYLAAGFIILALLGTGCTHNILVSSRAATNVPDHFLVGGADGQAATEPVADGACHNPMVDPRDGTRLTMTSASGGYGDYLVPDGKYGVGTGEVLRIRCATGTPVGIFPGQGDD